MNKQLVVACMLSSIPSVARAANEPLNNPLSPVFSTVPAFIAGFMKVIVMISLPVVAVYLVYAGYLYVYARGRGAELGTAHANIIGTLKGAALILGGWAIAVLIWGTLAPLLNLGGGTSSSGAGGAAPAFNNGAIQTLDGRAITPDPMRTTDQYGTQYSI